MTAPNHSDETQRLEALRSLGVLDTPPEERFDRLTRLARRVFDVPIALISLIDADRQWFKSRSGLEVSETPREDSFCARAIEVGGTFIINDTRQDPRFRDNPLVVGEPFVRFYAGRTLVAPDGSRLGTLCILDRVPRTLSSDDLQILDDLAKTAEQELCAVRLATIDELTGLANRRGAHRG